MTRSDTTDRLLDRFLTELRDLGAPVEVVEDVRRRRYEGPGTAPGEEWTARRARLTREYLGPAIDTLVRDYA